MSMNTFVIAALLLASSAHAKLKVVATVADLGAIAREVGGEEVQVEVLALPTQDPHFVDAKPSFVVALSRAEVLLLAGMDLEVGWLPTLLTGSRNGNIQPGARGYLDCSSFITAKEVPTGKLDRAMGDVHPGGNPHYGRDPRLAGRVARGIAARFAQLDPAHAEGYLGRAQQFVATLESRTAEWKKALAPFRGAPIVPYHKSWTYFTDFAGLEEVAFVEPKPGLAPSTGHVAKVLQVMRARKVSLILQEDFYPASTSSLLARSSGARLVRVPAMPSREQRYVQFMDELVSRVVEGLRR